MKCSKAKQNHIMYIFAEQREAQKIDIYPIYMPSGARPNFFGVLFPLKPTLQLLNLISKPQNLSKSKKIGKNRNFSEK